MTSKLKVPSKFQRDISYSSSYGVMGPTIHTIIIIILSLFLNNII
jgi:hypothetical protein